MKKQKGHFVEVFKKTLLTILLLLTTSCSRKMLSEVIVLLEEKRKPKQSILKDYYSLDINRFYMFLYENKVPKAGGNFPDNVYRKYIRGVYDGDQEPEVVPDLDRDAELKIPEDLNNNEVPDYYEVFINRGVNNELLRKLYKEMGKSAYRTFKSFDSLSKTQKKKALEEFFKPLNCATSLGFYDVIKDIKFSGDGGIKQLEINHKEALFSPGWREIVYDDLIASFDTGDVLPVGRMTPKEGLHDCPTFVFEKHPELKEVLSNEKK